MTEPEKTIEDTTLRALALALLDEEEAVRLSALAELSISAIASCGAPGLRLLIQAMGDISYRVRKQATHLCTAWPDPSLAAELLVDALAEPEDVGRRNAALEAVVRLGSQSVPFLLQALSSEKEHRKVLLDALGAIGDPRGAKALDQALADADPNVRAAAAEGLSQIMDPVVVSILRRALFGDRDWVVRLAALQGLNRHQVSLPFSEIAPLLNETVLKPSALLSLGYSGDPAALVLLCEALLDRAPGAREAAMAGLMQLFERMGQPASFRSTLGQLSELSVRSMIRALLEASFEARAAAAQLLGLSGKTEAIRPLILALLDQNPAVAQAAKGALLSFGAPALPPLSAMYESLPEGEKRGILAQAMQALLASPTAQV